MQIMFTQFLLKNPESLNSGNAEKYFLDYSEKRGELMIAVQGVTIPGSPGEWQNIGVFSNKNLAFGYACFLLGRKFANGWYSGLDNIVWPDSWIAGEFRNQIDNLLDYSKER